MGRTKRWSEDMVARFAEGTFNAIDAVSSTGEERTDFVREAVDREILRRWLVMREAMPANGGEDAIVPRHRDASRSFELTSSQAKEAEGTVTLTRTMLHALDGVVSRCVAILPGAGPIGGTLPRRSDRMKGKQA